jgi:hypothetical protein
MESTIWNQRFTSVARYHRQKLKARPFFESTSSVSSSSLSQIELSYF